MEHKKLHKWTEEEEELLKNHFHDMPFSSHGGSRFTYLKRLLEEQLGSEGITEKAISRKTWRLGLRSHEQTHELIEGKCHICGVELIHKHRYKNPLCEECRIKQKYAWNKTEYSKHYHRNYIKEWRKTKC